MNEKTIRRRSDAAFENALCTLLLDRPIEKITVKEICELADYTVTAFYKNYEDKYDLAKSIIEKEAKRLFESNYSAMSDPDYMEVEADKRKMSNNDNVINTVENHFNHILENSNVYKCIVSDKLTPNTIIHFTRAFCKYSQGHFVPEDKQEKEYEFYIGIYISSFLFTVSYWIDNKFSKSPLEMAKLYLKSQSSQTTIIVLNRE